MEEHVSREARARGGRNDKQMSLFVFRLFPPPHPPRATSRDDNRRQ